MKKFKKLLAKNTYAVFMTILFCIATFIYIQDFVERKTDSVKTLQEQVTKEKIDFEIHKRLVVDSLTRIAKNLILKEQELENIRAKTELAAQRIQLMEEKADDVLKLHELLEKLRTGFGAIEPGVQLTDREDYMNLYRENEATNILAQSYAKKLGLYNQYKDFFKNREGFWNIITVQGK